MSEARLEDAGSGLVPVSDGWFVVNVADAAWVVREGFGARCSFEASGPALREQPDREPRPFEQLGINVAVLEPGRPSTLYHAETLQEDFLVLAGECVALVEGEERALRAWDLLHCPPGTLHGFVGAGDGPCVLLMVGARREGRGIVYPRDELALRHGAGVEAETDSPAEAYAPYAPWHPGRPEGWDRLPWAPR